MSWSKNETTDRIFFLHLLCEFGNSWVPSYQKLEQHMKARDILPRFEDIIMIIPVNTYWYVRILF